MTLPSDPHMLVSAVNMKLRDGDYDGLDDLCASLGIDRTELESKLKAAGYEYNVQAGRFV